MGHDIGNTVVQEIGNTFGFGVTPTEGRRVGARGLRQQKNLNRDFRILLLVVPEFANSGRIPFAAHGFISSALCDSPPLRLCVKNLASLSCLPGYEQTFAPYERDGI